MRAIRFPAAAIVVAAAAAVAENPTFSGVLSHDVGSPCGYVAIEDENIPPGARVRFVRSPPVVGLRASIPQKIARRGPMRGKLLVALHGLSLNATYDVVIDRPGRRPLVAPAAYRTEHPTENFGGLTYMNDGRAGPGQHLLLWHESSGRRVRVEVGGVRARIVAGPWDLSDRRGPPYTETTFLLPELSPGPAEVVVSDECGWSASAGSIEVVANRREISFRAGGRRLATHFQEARGGRDWFRMDTTAARSRDVGFLFDLKSDVRTATLPATYTQSSPGAKLTLGWGGNSGWPSHDLEAGEWTLTVEEIADGEVRGTFSGQLVDTRKPHRKTSIEDGRFRLPFAIYE